MSVEAGTSSRLERDGLVLDVPAVAGSVSLVRHALRAALERWGTPEPRIADVVLASSEACSNAVVHAYRDRDAGRLQASLELAGEITVVIRDWGVGMTPHPERGGLGLGLVVIEALADDVDVRTPAGGGVEVVMVFTPAAAEPV